MAGDIYTASGTKLYISTTAVVSTTDTLTEYEALTWTEVAEVEDLGNVGDVSSEVMNWFTVASSGRGIPCGGIMPPCSFRRTFSQVSALSETRSRFRLSSVSPPVLRR